MVNRMGFVLLARSGLRQCIVLTLVNVVLLTACNRRQLSADAVTRVNDILQRLTAAAERAEAITGGYSTVWSKAIEDREDFNVALAAQRQSEPKAPREQS